MKKTWYSAGQILLTLIVVVVAALVLWRIINYYMFSPWTRDGHVRADVIQVAPDVAGLITSVQVADNQEVKRGQVLFVIDQARYTLAQRLAEATLAQRRATLAQAKREYARNLQLGNLVASEQVEESRTRVEQGEAAEQGKTLADHYAHLLVHGTLHAQGWDHETSEEDADEMEAYETDILAELGYADPYAKD